ncbi:hypothetical protein BASA81_017220 [Batrachochytrium salamandrivorans]|nr:hypothetical protein BASA81_017220 [Batrachochytrium salamandrivorans]
MSPPDILRSMSLSSIPAAISNPSPSPIFHSSSAAMTVSPIVFSSILQTPAIDVMILDGAIRDEYRPDLVESDYPSSLFIESHIEQPHRQDTLHNASDQQPQQKDLPQFSVCILAEEYPAELSPDTRQAPSNVASTKVQLYLKFIVDEQGLSERSFCVQWSHTCIEDVGKDQRFEAIISYRRKIEAFRALGHILGVAFEMQQEERIPFQLFLTSQAQFESIGCTLKILLLFPGEPFFGFMRGAYTHDEIRRIDSYALDFGIEVFPCIQTLGHFGQILQWPAYTHLRDTSEVLLANYSETYIFIRKIIQAASSCLQSRRIHVGMDEANGIGEGRYKQMFGSKEGTQIYVEHLQRIADICREEGLHPLVWSDMLFTLANQNDPQSYYDDTNITADLYQGLPQDIQLVYWDYYHTNADIYQRKIQQHRSLGFEPWVASAVWTWNRLFAALPFTFDAAKACLSACKQSSVRNVIITMWGDDGNECDMLSALPGLAYFGEQAYSTSYDVDWNTLKRNFAGVCGGRLEDWIYSSKLDSVPGPLLRRDRPPPNPSKWILWQDPIYSFLSPQYRNQNLEVHFSEISKYLFAASSETAVATYPLNYRLRFPALLAQTLQLKCNLREICIAAYRSSVDRRGKVAEVVETVVKPLMQAARDLHMFHRDQVWRAMFKPYGLEILEMRYGAVRARIETLHDRLVGFCQHLDVARNGSSSNDSNRGNGDEQLGGVDVCGRSHRAFPAFPDSSIPEFEEDLVLEPFPGYDMDLLLDFSRAYTPSRALGTG